MRKKKIFPTLTALLAVPNFLLSAFLLSRLARLNASKKREEQRALKAVMAAENYARDARASAEQARAAAAATVEKSIEQMEMWAGEMSMLKELAETLNQTLPPERALEVGLEQVAQQVGAETGWFLTITPDQKAELSAGYHLPENFELAGNPRLLTQRWALCACLKEMLTGTLTTPRLFQCERLARTPGRTDSRRQHLSIPVRASGVPVGILNLVFDHPREFDAAELQLISALGDQFGGASERARLFREVKLLASIDPLTGLLNRRSFLDRVAEEFERASRYRHPISLAVLDIDYFKTINDRFGHPVGDQTLESVANACQAAMRRIDFVGRFGGEEIVFLMPETGLKQAQRAMERLRKKVEELEISTGGEAARVTVSIGVACTMQEGVADFEHLFQRADQALYQAKSDGRNQVRVL